MKKEEAGKSSLIRSISGVVYKASHKYSEFVARFLGRAREESRGLVVFDNGITVI